MEREAGGGSSTKSASVTHFRADRIMRSNQTCGFSTMPQTQSDNWQHSSCFIWDVLPANGLPACPPFPPPQTHLSQHSMSVGPPSVQDFCSLTLGFHVTSPGVPMYTHSPIYHPDQWATHLQGLRDRTQVCCWALMAQ